MKSVREQLKESSSLIEKHLDNHRNQYYVLSLPTNPITYHNSSNLQYLRNVSRDRGYGNPLELF
jgi:hypothetical protein